MSPDMCLQPKRAHIQQCYELNHNKNIRQKCLDCTPETFILSLSITDGVSSDSYIDKNSSLQLIFLWLALPESDHQLSDDPAGSKSD